MSLDTVSRILAVEVAWPHIRQWGLVTCALLLSLTYFFWPEWTSGIQCQSGRQVTEKCTRKGEDDDALKGKDKFSSDGNDNILEAAVDQVNISKPHDDFLRLAVNNPKRRLPPEKYTVGWICAIGTEHVAAQAFLDEEHERLHNVPENDNNDYTLGSVGRHNVVIVVLPIGEYGIAAAASVARDMSRSFPNVRIRLMVGIGGGAPSQKHDIRLGDIVVGVPNKGHGGVFQYDFGKRKQDGTFHTTGFLNMPPRFLLTAVNGLKSQYEKDGHQLEKSINSILERNPTLQAYARPHPSTDRLYRREFVHPPDDEASCTTCCGDDPSNLVPRHGWTGHEDNPTVHYGLIASANQVMQDPLTRDRLIEAEDVLCFEMEAAGLMNQFPCLVIRGICDYSDSHKNKIWQGYAAMAAAAYAKDLLRRVSPNNVEAAKSTDDAVERNQCLQLFRLTGRDEDTTYERYKNSVNDRVEGTCQWFLQQNHFKEWLKQDSGPLIVSADPGCGKSVLARYLVERVLPQSSTICYFFFKEQDQNKVFHALCALLHQLLYQNDFLIDHAIPYFRKDGTNLINSTQSLWTILGNAVKDPRAGPVIFVLDALDECAESDLGNLLRNVVSQFGNDSKLKCLLTSRPYERIMIHFRDVDLLKAFPNIHIPGEEESEAISREVNLVITHHVNQLSEKKRLSSDQCC